MSTTAAHPERPAAAAPNPRSRRRLPHDLFLIATAVETVAFALLLGTSGAVTGRLVRVAVVVVLGCLSIVVGRRSRIGRELSALVLGILGIVAGLGIGLHRLAFIPLVLLLAGLTLLSYGGVRLTRRLPRWWRLTAIPAALLVLTFVVFPLAIAVYATNVPREKGSAATPSSRGLAYHEVRLRTSDGATLAAWYIPSANRGAVVLTHGSGAGSTKASVLSQAEVIAKSGYGVLLVDARGHGDSSGNAMDFGWYGERDISAAVSYLARQRDVDPQKIGVVGESMGGEEAIGAAGVDPRIAAVVSEGTTGRTAADHGWLPSGVSGAIQRGIDFIAYNSAGLLTSAPEPKSLRSAIRAAAPHPVLLIAAGKSTDEASAANYLRAASPSSVQVWVVPGSGHTQGLSVARAAWTSTVIGFLNRTLRPAGR